MKHLNEHLRRANQKLAIAKGQLNKGMVIEIMYKPDKGNLKRYVLTVLNPSFQGKMHAISMENVSYGDYASFVESTGIKYIPKFQKYRGVDIPKVTMDISSNRFYYSRVKGAPSLDTSYRMFNINKINSVRLIDYNFDEHLMKKFLFI